jgi:hypothetical protein
VSLSALFLYSFASAALRWKDLKSDEPVHGREWWKKTFKGEFLWFASRQGLVGMFTGIACFLVLLLLPVLMTGSWTGVHLMWKENVVRFFSPFDHRGPIYTYIQYIPMFSAPWTLLVIAALWELRRLEAGEARRWVSVVALGIFMFFTLSGSRRSYYILPLVPALALITGAALSNWLETAGGKTWPVIRSAALATSGLIAIAGLAIVYVIIYLHPTPGAYRSGFQVALGLCILLGGSLAFYLLGKAKAKEGLAVLLLFIFITNLWIFNVGMRLAEGKRTLRPFCVEVTKRIAGVEPRKIALFGEDASLLFYLNRKGLDVLSSMEQIRQFQKECPDGFLIADLDVLEESGNVEDRRGMVVALMQKADVNEPRGQYALLRFMHEEPPQVSR